MTEWFLKIVSLSLSASWLVAAVIGFRFLLKRSPKAMHVAMWGLVALRLMLPVSFESNLSLVPESVGSGEVVTSWMLTPVAPHVLAEKPEIPLTEPSQQTPQNMLDPGTIPQPDHVSSEAPVTMPTLGDTLLPGLCAVWLLGMGIMALYALGSYIVLWLRVRTAVVLKPGIYQSEYAPTAFVLGLLRPRIFVPCHMADTDLTHVIAHERAHIKRADHWWKPLGYLLLTIHWFNPLMWAAYSLLCRDIELACDEHVIRSLKHDQRADYSQTLLNCSIHNKMILACPVAFGQAGLQERVKNVLTYRKPGLWIILVTVASIIISMVCFFSVPPAQAEEPETPPVGPGTDATTSCIDTDAYNTGSSVDLITSDGIAYTVSVSNVTPVGLSFSVNVETACTFLIQNYFWIERQTETGWQALPARMEDPCHLAQKFGASGNNIFPGPTDTRPVDWSGIYGVLEPGTYRLWTTVFEGEDPCSVEFVIGDPGDSPAALALLRYYDALNALLSRESYHVVNTYSSVEDPSVDVDADMYDYNDINTYEYMRSGDNYLVHQFTYTAGMLTDGMLIRDGVEYRLENAVSGNGTTPGIGWAQNPSIMSHFFTRWVPICTADQIESVTVEENVITLSIKYRPTLLNPGSCLRDTFTITFDENGDLEQVVQVAEYQGNRPHTSVNTMTVMDSGPEEISRFIELQDVNFCRDFTWNGTLPENETAAEREFLNTESVILNTVSEVIDHAKRECSVIYSNIMVYHDAENGIWKVEFQVGNGKASTESVYLNADGKTLMITNRGPLDI